MTDVTIVAATSLEAAAVRRASPGVRVVNAGIGLARLHGAFLGETVITCGLAGALVSGIPPGTVLVPATIVRPDGTLAACDPEIVAALTKAANARGHAPLPGPIFTSRSLVRGAARAEAAKSGAIAVEMESGLLDVPRLATIRVVLDTPERELSDAWLVPWRAAMSPRAWPQLLWLVRDGPRFARRAAQIVAAALGDLTPS
ncbi:MAG: hypothetical protein JOY59_09370 [Candidatus Eremiobacteraeota bacterium]|nr:hypothetical protein [Candidatus Eremiobacteraeota bacterium]